MLNNYVWFFKKKYIKLFYSWIKNLPILMSNYKNFKLLSKFKSLFKIIFYEFLTLFILLIRFILFLLQPIILVRIGFIHTTRIGDIARNFDRLIHLQKIRKNNKDFYFFFHDKIICNKFLKNLLEKESKKFKSKVYLFNVSLFSKLLSHSYSRYKFGKSYFFDFEIDKTYNKLLYTMCGKEINFKLNLEEEAKGQKFIEKLKISKDKKWICVHNRDSHYLDKFNNQDEFKHRDFNYHSYRDFDVNNLSGAVDLFINSGYHVFRMGNMQSNKSNYHHPNFIDYPFIENKSDFNDIFLLSNCSAYFGSDSGIGDIPLIFGKPRYLINFSLSLIYIFHQDGDPVSYKNNYSLIFKHLFDRKKQRKLSLKEMFKNNLFAADRSEIFEKAGVDLIENTPDEIVDIANETLENLNNKNENINDYYEQKKFWDIYYDNTNFKRYEDIPLKICSKFLLKNPYILE